MKLLSIHLHPFGASIDRSCTLHQGLNVLEGPNEFGKSTLSHALWHALFTPSNLTPAKLVKTIGRWYPLPAGDHARVTLRFEAEGKPWTLEKTWGAGGTSRLQADGAAALADPTKVQEKLQTLLRLNEATWKQVLFTGQAQLAATVGMLEEHGSALEDVHGLLAGAAAIPGDIASEKLRTGIGERIDAHFSRWDTRTMGPEGGKGITNAWKNKLGPVVEAYYAKEALRVEHGSVVSYEQELDATNARISRLQDALKDDADFVKQGGSLRDGLGRRATLEETRTRLTEKDTALMQVVTAWPGAQQVIDGKEQEMGRIGETLIGVDAELQHARQRAQAEQVRKGHAALTAAKEAWDRAAKALASSTAVDEKVLKALKDLERKLRDLDIQIAAQKLAAKLESRAPLTVTVQRGTEAPESVALAPDASWEGDASGRIRVEVGELTISVQSGQEDVDALFAQRDQALNRQTGLLITAGAGSLAALEEAHKAHGSVVQEEASKRGLYTAALQDKTPEQWAAEMAALAALPQTRDLATLETERNKHLKQQAELKAGVDQERKRVAQWTTEHGDVGQLMVKVVALKAELDRTTKELEALPQLPAGFSTVADYLQLLKKKEQAQSTVQEQLQAEKLKHAELMGRTPARTAEDLRAELDLKEREYQRQLAEGQALLRIQAKLEHVIAQRGGGDPLQGLTDAITTHFTALTGGRYTSVQLDGTAPAQVNGSTALPTGLLSQGTLGSLALATRLALAELYLKDDSGFLVMDDPFTDMDPARRSAAAKAIGDFAKERQVLFFTCHPPHATELQEVAGAEAVGMN